MSTFTKPLATATFMRNPRKGEALPIFGLDLDFEENLAGANPMLQKRVADAGAIVLHELLNDFPCF